MIAYVFFETKKELNANVYTSYRGVWLCNINERANSLYENVSEKYRRAVALRIKNALLCEYGISVEVKIKDIYEAEVSAAVSKNVFTRLYKDVTESEQII